MLMKKGIAGRILYMCQFGIFSDLVPPLFSGNSLMVLGIKQCYFSSVWMQKTQFVGVHCVWMCVSLAGFSIS